MCSLMALLLPSVLGLRFLLYLKKEETISWGNKIYFYLTLLLLSNTFSFIVSKIFFATDSNISLLLESYPVLCAKYIFTSIIINIIIVFTIAFICKRLTISIELEEQKNDKKNI